MLMIGWSRKNNYCYKIEKFENWKEDDIEEKSRRIKSEFKKEQECKEEEYKY